MRTKFLSQYPSHAHRKSCGYPHRIQLPTEPQNPTYPYPHPVFSLQDAYFNLLFVTLTVGYYMMYVLCESLWLISGLTSLHETPFENKITNCTYSSKLKHTPFISCLTRYFRLIKNPHRVPMGLWGWTIIPIPTHTHTHGRPPIRRALSSKPAGCRCCCRSTGSMVWLFVRLCQGCSERGRRGDGVPPLFRQAGDASPNPRHFFGLKFVQKIVHCCNWLFTETQCKIISVQHVCRPKLFKNLCLRLVSGVPSTSF